MDDILGEHGENFSLVKWEVLEKTVEHSGVGVKRARSRTYFTRRAEVIGG